MESSSSSSSDEISNNSSNNSKEGKVLYCFKCGKEKARKTCSQHACFKCCDDLKCIGHRNQRIMDGSSWINKQAARKRALAVRKGSFRESSFHYLGETLLLWDVKQYMSNSKWRDDALRRSRKNRELLSMGNKKGISRPQKKGSRKQRFEKVWAEILLQNKVECETTRS